MNVVPLLLLCSLLLVAGSIVVFVWSVLRGDCHEADRLCLLPLEEDHEVQDPAGAAPPPSEDSSCH